MLQELRAGVDNADLRSTIHERLREFDDQSRVDRSEAESADSAWRIVQNLLAEELAELNAGLDPHARIGEKDRLALPDGTQAIEVTYRDQKFSITRSKDKRSLALIDPSAGRLPIEHVGSKLFLGGEPIGSGLLDAIARLIERATVGVSSRAGAVQRYMVLELRATSAARVETMLNLAGQNGFRFLESYACASPDRRVFLFERVQGSAAVAR